MKQIFLALALAGTVSAQVVVTGSNLQIGGTSAVPCTNCVQTNHPGLQTLAGPLASSYIQSSGAIPFAVSGQAAVGFNASGFSEADWYTMTNGGAANPAHSWWGINSGGSAFQNLMTLNNNGILTPNGGSKLLAGDCYAFAGTVQGVCDDNAGGISYSTTASASNGHSFYRNTTLQWQIDGNGNFKTGTGAIALPGTGITGYTGAGNTVFSNAPTLVNPVVGTQTTGDNSTKAASTAFVQNAVSAISSGVVSINGQGGAFTFTGNVTCTGTSCVFSASGIANTTLTPFGSTTAVAANTCTSPATFTMTGVLASPQSNVWAGFQGNPTAITGWGSSGGLQLDLWVSAANTVSWIVCNPTGSSITSGTPTFIISAQ